MARGTDPRAIMREMRRRARRALLAARPAGSRIAVTSRVNAVVVAHTGEQGATTAASARQEAPIRQGGDEQGGDDSEARGVAG
jgi:Flp pilus assembly CpaE family ATPase